MTMVLMTIKLAVAAYVFYAVFGPPLREARRAQGSATRR